MKINKLLILFLILMIAFPFSTYANGETKTSDTAAKEISEQVAMNVSKNFLEKSPFDWKDAKVIFVDNFYDLNDKVLGYYYNILKDNKTVGYILVSATKELPPILQFGESTLSYEADEKIKYNKMYYLGAFKYEFGKNASEIKEKLSKNNIKVKDLYRDSKLHEQSWSRLLNRNDTSTNESMISIQSYTTELPVIRVWQRLPGVNWPDSSCGPTTGAMIANYYESKGYNVRDYSYYGGNAQLINHLYREMGSTAIGTTANNWGYGMVEHLDHNYTDDWQRITQSAQGNWTWYESAINKNRPVALRFDLYTNPNTYSDYHFVCGMGIYYEGEETYAGVKDPDGGQYNTGTHYFSWVVNAPDMTMIVPYYSSW